MYNYQDFKHKFGQDDLEIKMLKIYDYMEKGKQYSTEGLFSQLVEIHGKL